MTDLIQHPDVDVDPLDDGPSLEPRPAPDRRGGRSPRQPAQVLLAVLAGSLAACCFMAGAQALHGSRVDAVAFAAVGWGALLIAMLALIRPTPRVYAAGVVGGAALACFWAAQLLFTTHGATSAAAVTRLALAGAVAVLSGLLLSRPDLGRTWDSSTSVLGSVLPVAVVIVVTAVLVTSGTSTSSSTVVAGGATKTTPTTERRTVDPLAAVPVPGQSSGAFTKLAQGNDTEQSELKPYQPLSAADQLLLDHQLQLAEQAALRFPTVKDAKAAGMILAGGMAPGVGAHYQAMSASSLKGVNPDGTINASFPASWIYAGTGDNDPVVGIMYESLSDTPPSGFAGPNDHWHQHSNLCIQFTAGEIKVPFAPDSNVTPEQCASVHGDFMKKTVWMVHAWVVPGWESPQGVFSHANLHVYCPGNTYLVDPLGFCLRQS
jgi:hypothetical protein